MKVRHWFCWLVVAVLAPLGPAMAEGVEYLSYEDFGAVDAPNWPPGWSRENTNGDARQWETWEFGGSQGGTCVRYLSDAAIAADDWFFSPACALSGGVEYTLSFEWRTTSSAPPHTLSVWIGGANSSVGMTSEVVSLPGLASEAVQEATATFVAGGSGDYHLGFHCLSSPGSLALFIDSIRLSAPESDLEVHLQLDKVFYNAGGVTYATDEEKTCLVHVDNAGASPLTVNGQLAVGEVDDPAAVLSFLITDPDGLTVPFEANVKRAEPEADDLVTILPGESVYKYYDLNVGVFDFLKSGGYTLQAVYKNLDQAGLPATWRGRLVSDPVTLTIE